MSKSYTISLTNKAKDDLDKIFTYISEYFEESSAKKAIEVLFKTFQSLANYPKIGRDLKTFNIELVSYFLFIPRFILADFILSSDR